VRSGAPHFPRPVGSLARFREIQRDSERVREKKREKERVKKGREDSKCPKPGSSTE
jgi:hypothetical protein